MGRLRCFAVRYREEQPRFIPPMLLTSGPVPDGDQWALELKWDGCRAQLRYDGRSMSLRTRNGRECSEDFGELTGIAAALGKRRMTLDGELVCLREVVFEGYVYVLRKLDFRRIFDQVTAVLVKAKTAARELHKQVPIANFGDFEQACSSDSRLADKLLAVRGRDYFSRLNYAMLQPVISQFNLTIPTKDVNGQTQLVFESGPAGRFRILKLVDDDYLRSSMTGHGYEANSKSQAN
jgi:hypothetical protein